MEFDILVKDYCQSRNNQHKSLAILALMEEKASEQVSDFYYGRYLYYKAEHLCHTNKLQLSFKILRQAYTHLVKYEESSELIFCLNLFGVLSDLNGDCNGALDYYYKAIDVAVKLNNDKQVIFVINNIGDLFLSQQAYEKAILFFNEALVKTMYSENNVRINSEVCIRLNLGHAYALGAHSKKALVQLHKLQKIDDKLFRNKSFDLHFLECIILCNQKNKSNLENVAQQLNSDINESLSLETIHMLISATELWISCGLLDLVWNSLQVISKILANIKSSASETQLQRAYLKYYQAINEQEKYEEMAQAYVKSIEKQEAMQMLAHVQSLKDKMALHDMNVSLNNTMQQAVTDQLTGIYNRRYLMDHVVNRYNKVKGLNQEIGFLILDIDYFKQCNDQYGHLYGDKCLKALSSIIKQVISDDIIAIRYGGDEFMLVFFNQSLQQISDVATFIQQAVTNLQYHSDKVTNRLLSVSIGIYIGKPYQDDNIYDFIRNADKALYKAKESKNTISIFEQ